MPDVLTGKGGHYQLSVVLCEVATSMAQAYRIFGKIVLLRGREKSGVGEVQELLNLGTER